MKWLSTMGPASAIRTPLCRRASTFSTIISTRNSALLRKLRTSVGSVGSVGSTSRHSSSLTASGSAITNDDASFLAQMLTAGREPRQGKHDSVLAFVLSTGSDVNGSTHAPPPLSPVLQGFKPAAVLRFLETLISVNATEDETQMVTNVLQAMSSTSFSEMLRSLDPLTAVGPELDALFGRFVGPGMAQATQIGTLVDLYGIRGIYTLLFDCVKAAIEKRMEAGHDLLASDYKQFTRCAGATCDPNLAWAGFKLLRGQGGLNSLRDGELLTELTKARFLTEPLYTQFDKMRRRVVPINLYKQKGHLRLQSHSVARLRTIRRSIVANQWHRYGQNKNMAHAEHLTRTLRKTKPIVRFWAWQEDSGYRYTEDFICSAMVGFARAGSIARVRHILYKTYGIQIQNRAAKDGVIEIRGHRQLKRGDPREPTVKLLETVVECFGSNAEVVTALRLLVHIAARYRLTIPDKVWFDLMSWTQVRLSKPTKTEWDVLRWPDKAVPADALVQIWRIMTTAPYNVRPGFEQYDIMIKFLISRGAPMFNQAIRLMLEAYPQYEAAREEVEEAAYHVALADRAGMDQTAARRRWNQAMARREHMWYCIAVWCWNIPKKLGPRSPLDSAAVRLIPRFIGHFRAFFVRNITYNIATGTVTILQPDHLHRIARHRYVTRLPPLVTGDLARRPWDMLKPLKGFDVPLGSFHRRRQKMLVHRANPRYAAVNANHLRDRFANQPLTAGEIQRQFL